MSELDLPPLPSAALGRAQALLSRSPRVVLGLVGPPGCGKSTVAEALQRALGPTSVVVPMDGYHLANVQLARLGRAHRKGAADTFDSAGYADLLARIRSHPPHDTIYAPSYERKIEEAVAGAIAVPPEARLVITEGNYLLFDDGPWARVRPALDEVWYVDVDDAVRLPRLIRRHQQFGRTLASAQDWVRDTDEPNARLIAQTRDRADWVFRWDA